MSGGKTVKSRKTARGKVASGRKSPAKKTVKRKTAKKKVVKKKAVKKKVASKKPASKKPASKKPARKKSVKKKTAKKPSGSAVGRVVRAAKKSPSARRKATRVEKLVFSELENLADYIHSAKLEIAAIRPDEVKDEFLPSAESELEAIVEATADATHAIMDACEGIEGVMASIGGDAANSLMDATTKIYEACTFQDITGQRIGKVVKALQHIEGRIDRLIEVFEVKIEKPAHDVPEDTGGKAAKTISDEDLLEGPQLEGQGRSQAEIDDLLASFD